MDYFNILFLLIYLLAHLLADLLTYLGKLFFYLPGFPLTYVLIYLPVELLQTPANDCKHE